MSKATEYKDTPFKVSKIINHEILMPGAVRWYKASLSSTTVELGSIPGALLLHQLLSRS